MFNRWGKIRNNVVEEIYYAKPDDVELTPQDGVEFMVIPLFVSVGYFVKKTGNTIHFTPPISYSKKSTYIGSTIERKQT